MIKTTLRQLSELDVRYVSLVDKGANRLPFKIVKSLTQPENSMIDLGKISLKKAAKAVPTVAAVVLAKNDKAMVDKTKAIMKAESIDLTMEKVFKDGTVALAIADGMDKEGMVEGGTVVRLSENVAVVLKNFEAPAAFGGAEGFLYGVTEAGEVMAASIKKSAPDAAKVAADFGKYTEAMQAALPAAVLKVEASLIALEVTKAAATQDIESEVSEVAGGGDDGDLASDGTGVMTMTDYKKRQVAALAGTGTVPDVYKKADMGDGEEPADDGGKRTAAEWKAWMDSKKGKKAAPVEKSDKKDEPSADMVALLKAVTTLSESVTTLSAKVTKSEENFTSQIAEVTRKADDSLRVVKGTVVNSAQNGDPEQTEVRKSAEDEDEYSGVFDTAMIRKRAPIRQVRR